MQKGFSRKECPELSCEREVEKGDHEEVKQTALVEETGKTGRAFPSCMQGLGLYFISNHFKLHARKIYSQICIVDFSLWWYWGNRWGKGGRRAKRYGRRSAGVLTAWPP